MTGADDLQILWDESERCTFPLSTYDLKAVSVQHIGVLPDRIPHENTQLQLTMAGPQRSPSFLQI